MSKRQKAKGAKRPRSWHRGPLEDQRFAAATQAFGDEQQQRCAECGTWLYPGQDIKPLHDRGCSFYQPDEGLCPGSEKWGAAEEELGKGRCPDCGALILCDSGGILHPHWKGQQP
jgi:hypothetical protein